MKSEKRWRVGGLTVVWGDRSGQLEIATMWKETLVLAPALGWLRPVLNGQAVAWGCTGVEEKGQTLQANFAADGLTDARLYLRARPDYLELQSEFTVVGPCELNRLEVAPPNTGLNLYEVVNFRNRHFTPRTWPELNLGGDGCTTDTCSGDWQFAPHPTLFVFRKDDLHLFFGALDLPRAFGMYLDVRQYRVRHWYLDYGPAGHGQSLRAGERFQSPRFGLFLDRGRTVYETLGRYTRLLVRAGLVPDPRRKRRHAWHTQPLYCTWIDQTYAAKASVPAALKQQEPAVETATAQLTEAFVRAALAVMEREKLPFRTILLDEGWEVARGQWEPHPERFPNFRGLVDEIHARGMKVIVWWNWAELADDVPVAADHLMARGKRNRHGRRMRDYSHPRTQREYLAPLFRTLFSSAPGCYDLDGVKTDFQADKVHADMAVHDPRWRGEENYIYHLYKLFYRLMRRFKPDACHIGCAGHPWLAQCIDVNRTYDVHSSDVREHAERARMLAATAPLCPVAFDFHSFEENSARYFQVARRLGAAVEIGNLQWVRRNVFASPRPAGPTYYRLLRRELNPNPQGPEPRTKRSTPIPFGRATPSA